MKIECCVIFNQSANIQVDYQRQVAIHWIAFFLTIYFVFIPSLLSLCPLRFFFLERTLQRSCECITRKMLREEKCTAHDFGVFELETATQQQRKLYKWSVCARIHTFIPVEKEMLGRPLAFVICFRWMLKCTTIHCAYLRFFACAVLKSVNESEERKREREKTIWFLTFNAWCFCMQSKKQCSILLTFGWLLDKTQASKHGV